jgi:hypothetical protein
MREIPEDLCFGFLSVFPYKMFPVGSLLHFPSRIVWLGHTGMYEFGSLFCLEIESLGRHVDPSLMVRMHAYGWCVHA